MNTKNYIKKTQNFILLYVVIFGLFNRQLSYFNFILEDSTLYSVLIYVFFRIFYVTIIFSWIIIVYENRIKKDVILLLFFFSFSILTTMLLFNRNSIFFPEFLPFLIYSISIYSILRSGLLSHRQLIKIAINISRVLLIFIIISLYVKLNWVTSSIYMNFSDALSLVAGLVLYSAFSNRKWTDYILAIIGFLGVLFFGSRGATLSLAILYFILYFNFYNRKPIRMLSLFIIIILGIIFYNQTLLILINLFDDLGLYSRPLVSLYESQLFESSGRSLIYSSSLDIIANNWVFGVGLAGDRFYLLLNGDSVYVHNIILEIYLHFGIFLGTIILFLFIMSISKNLVFNKIISKQDKAFLYVFMTTSLLQLMFSRSYLTEINLFLFMGLLLNAKMNFSTKYYKEVNTT